jgi:8-oxo-dGTP diphosphatase
MPTDAGPPRSSAPPARVVPRAVVLAILTVGDAYALQHRDERPDVASPGHWALFGGAVQDGETAVAAIRREIGEELGLDVERWRDLWTVRCAVPFWGAEVPHHIYAADVTAVWERHVLGEGQAAAVFPISALPRPMEPLVIALLERYHASVRGRR